MNRLIVANAIEVMTKLFFEEGSKNNELAFKAMEIFIELGLMKDIRLVAEVIEAQKAFALLEKIKLFDVIAAGKIEDLLKGY
ncbi:hypothetical protein [Neobacillus niacini]|uniref:hypothetical protein n=1 Tax=Neobacillus niacini TaxID=86668 RepID=UPI0005EE9278|nr:hypothetical protein [Neobacillus niacini]